MPSFEPKPKNADEAANLLIYGFINHSQYRKYSGLDILLLSYITCKGIFFMKKVKMLWPISQDNI